MERSAPAGPSKAEEPQDVRNLDDDGEVRRYSSHSDAPVDDSNLPVEVRPVSIGVGIDAQLVTVHTGSFVAGIKSVSAESSLLLASWRASNSPGAPELRDAPEQPDAA